MASVISQLYREGKFNLVNDSSVSQETISQLLQQAKLEGNMIPLGVGKTDSGKVVTLCKDQIVYSTAFGVDIPLAIVNIIPIDPIKKVAYLILEADLNCEGSIKEYTDNSKKSGKSSFKAEELKKNQKYAATAKRVDVKGLTPEQIDEPETVKVRIAHLGQADEKAVYLIKRLKDAADGTFKNQYAFELDALCDSKKKAEEEKPALYLA